MDHDPIQKPLYRSLYFQVITVIVIGTLVFPAVEYHMPARP